MSELLPRASDPMHMRNVLGQFPTGVVVITAVAKDGTAVGLTVGSFTSVSLDPPLVAFMAQAGSASWRKIETSGAFCVNVLTYTQEHVCRAMATRRADKFSGIAWHPAASGSPVLDKVAAWIDCDIESVIPAGDHFIVLARVRDLDVAEATAPLIFYQGGYGRFSSSTLAANDADLMEQLAVVDVARPHMTELSGQMGAECLAIALVEKQVVVVASSGAGRTERRLTRVGTRVPFAPPGGYVFAAWAPDTVVNTWLQRHARRDHPEDVDIHLRRLERIRQRGFSLGLGGAAHHQFGTAARALRRSETEDRSAAVARLISMLADDYEPEDLSVSTSNIETITAPVFDKRGKVVLALVMYGLPDSTAPTQVDQLAERLLSATRAITATIGSQSHRKSEAVVAHPGNQS
ncbi:flavin reductase [Mycobacterium arosiense]|uniref:IclR-ED domain-containing protein n=1 Tax=Mycobacterium arosiense ATCC BAA-1401 = DSM 45069 TaxID=1265311 RepID=A0A1W9ZC02_MYCAI|nr:flavin reductase [Mycobacterium arosiense]ORA11298.1 hypothetical protein BST14_18920 [Mycobacterium arosiense ATCC BAA-1401 = DSM 45069]